MDQPWMYIVLFGLVLIVYARMLPRTTGSSSQSGATAKEIEETMVTFAAEMEEQNQAVIQLFGETRKEYEAHIVKLSEKIDQLEKQSGSLTTEIAKLQVSHAHVMKQLDEKSAALRTVQVQTATQASAMAQAAAEQTAPQPEQAEPVKAAPLMNIKERYAELFALIEQGKSIDQVARKLGMNKGEVTLIIQLAKQEERLSV